MTFLKHTQLCLSVSISMLTPASAMSAPWNTSASPIVVHEWGVNYHDWQGDPLRIAHDPDLPPFFYTDKKPGKAIRATFKVKNSPTNFSATRFKPLLYFYGAGPIGLEARFEYGHANAWYPQVNVYRDPKMVKDAKAIDWKAWQKKNQLPNLISGHPANVPDDPRFELVWHNLTLDSKLSPSALAPNEDHWLTIARDVDATTVSNGKEHEKFIFYEGATSETPAITILPTEKKKSYQLINTSKHPIYDVFIIYRKGEQRYVKYHPELKQGLVGISFPNFSTEKFTSLTEKEFKKQTTEHLLNTLTSPKAPDIPKLTNKRELDLLFIMKDPADPQGATTGHSLFLKEAKGLEKIWRKDFFEQEGLTIIYRESPTYLDEAMPLNIYTDMHHYIQLNRCGLVCNSNIDLRKLSAVYEATPKILYGDRQPVICRENPILKRTYLQYLLMKGQEILKNPEK